MRFVWISEHTAIISLYNINWLVCITEKEGVYCAVRIGSLNTIHVTQNSATLLRTTAVSILRSSCTYSLIFILLLREGRAGEAWEPSNKEVLSLSLPLPRYSPAVHFILLFYNFICLALYWEIIAVCFAFRRLYTVSITPLLLDIHPRLSMHEHSGYQTRFYEN
jgi:hypothetical protein